jgi:hypothetical protein
MYTTVQHKKSFIPVNFDGSYNTKARAVPLHATKALGGEEI